MPVKPQPNKRQEDSRLPSAADLDVVAEEQRVAGEGYLHRDAVAADIFANEVLDGPMDETISSRVRRVSDAHLRWGWNPGVWIAKALNAGLNLIQRNHGAKAQAGDLERAKRVGKIEERALGIQGGIGAKRRRIG